MINTWKPGGGGDAFTFAIGYLDGQPLYLDSYHTNKSNLQLNQTINTGNLYATLNETFDYGGWKEAKVHFTLFTGKADFMNGNPVDMAPDGLPVTMLETHKKGVPPKIVYQGANFCKMTSTEKIQAINEKYLPNAGFCLSGNEVNYCGTNSRFKGLVFTQENL